MPTNPLNVAQQLAKQGLNVFPARYKDRATLVKWRAYQTKRVEEQTLRRWFLNATPINYWVMTGQMSKVIVIDCDNAAGERWWRERLGTLMDATLQTVTARGKHYWFRIPKDYAAPIRGWATHPPVDCDDPDSWPSFDLRADGGGVIVPPSTHPTGIVYQWNYDTDQYDHPIDAALPAPAELLDGTWKAQAPKVNGSEAGGTNGQGEGKRKDQPRSMLSHLLANPPGQGGRNDWLAKVAGHYAKQYRAAEDLYTTHCQQANRMLQPPLSETEFLKTIDSIWDTEHHKDDAWNPEAANADNGYLLSAGDRIMCCIKVGGGKDMPSELALAEWANFDLRATGVTIDDEGTRGYHVRLTRKGEGSSSEGGEGEGGEGGEGSKPQGTEHIIDGAMLGDDRALRKWLASYGCTILPPDGQHPRDAGSPATRLQRYLEAQRPPVVRVTPVIGWDDRTGGYIVPGGTITATGLQTTAVGALSLTPGTPAASRYHYGFHGGAKGKQQARAVLREVLTFHHEEVAAVFGSWWAACLIKPQIMARASLFPFMALEAPSESGKTNGLFSMLIQLSGNTGGERLSTKAALRDQATWNRSGIVWIDDPDDPSNLMELLRAATSEGSVDKMGGGKNGAGWGQIQTAQIVAPVVLSGESLGIAGQKALIDRSIRLHVPSPTGRMSQKGKGEGGAGGAGEEAGAGERTQWQDILDLREREGDLSKYAGWLLQEAATAIQDGSVKRWLQEGWDVIRDVAESNGSNGGGRAAERAVALHAGGRLLDRLVGIRESEGGGYGHWTQAVDAWSERTLRAELPQDNTLTMKILPWALRKYDYPDSLWILDSKDGGGPVPVYIEQNEDGQEEIWFNTTGLAQAWYRERHGRVDQRTETAEALAQQVERVSGPRVQKRVRGSRGKRTKCHRLNMEMARIVMERAQS